MFRKLKNKLLDQKEFSRYMKYAFGEIILVMLGILLALQVNNWNENQKKHQKEMIILHELNKDFTNIFSKSGSIGRSQFSGFCL